MYYSWRELLDARRSCSAPLKRQIDSFIVLVVTFCFLASSGKKAAGAMATLAKKAPNPTDKHVGSRVRMRRMMLGLSQKKLGKSRKAVNW